MRIFVRDRRLAGVFNGSFSSSVGPALSKFVLPQLRVYCWRENFCGPVLLYIMPNFVRVFAIRDLETHRSFGDLCRRV
jgi:hypothetical protein